MIADTLMSRVSIEVARLAMGTNPPSFHRIRAAFPGVGTERVRECYRSAVLDVLLGTDADRERPLVGETSEERLEIRRRIAKLRDWKANNETRPRMRGIIPWTVPGWTTPSDFRPALNGGQL